MQDGASDDEVEEAGEEDESMGAGKEGEDDDQIKVRKRLNIWSIGLRSEPACLTASTTPFTPVVLCRA